MNDMLMSPSISNLAPALLKAQSNMGDASKDSKNPFFKSSYADLNSLRQVALPTLNANGIVVLQPIVSVNGKSFVRTLLIHSSGEWLASDTEVVSAKPNDPQAHGSGISYARRYGLQSMLNIGASDDDGEKAMARTTTSSTATSGSVTISTSAATPTFPTGQTSTASQQASTSQEPTKRARTFKKNGNGASATTPVANAGDNF